MGNVRYFVYGNLSCPYCVEAQELLLSRELEHIFFLEEDEEQLSYLKSFFKQNTIPVVLENNLSTGETKLVGGCSDLKERLSNGKM